jgi:hypothetical protein
VRGVGYVLPLVVNLEVNPTCFGRSRVQRQDEHYRQTKEPSAQRAHSATVSSISEPHSQFESSGISLTLLRRAQGLSRGS